MTDKLKKVAGLRDGGAALLFCHLSSATEPFDELTAAKTLGMTEAEFYSALTKLISGGVVKMSELKGQSAAKTPEIPPPDFSDAAFTALAADAERRLGRILSPGDLRILHSIRDWRGFPPEVIELITARCIERTRERYGEGRMPTLKAIDAEAAIWEKEGAVTVEAAVDYLKRLAERGGARNRVLKMLGISDRKPSPTEERYINDWVGADTPFELIERAYDMTAVKTGKMAWSYCDKILKNWREKGFRTLDDVNRGDLRPPPSTVPKNAGTYGGGSEFGDRERAARDEMADFLRNLGIE